MNGSDKLSAKDVKRLDGIVEQMMANNETDEYIQAVVDDFKSIYIVKKKEDTVDGTDEFEIYSKEDAEAILQEDGEPAWNSLQAIQKEVERRPNTSLVEAHSPEGKAIYDDLKNIVGNTPYEYFTSKDSQAEVRRAIDQKYPHFSSGAMDEIVNTYDKNYRNDVFLQRGNENLDKQAGTILGEGSTVAERKDVANKNIAIGMRNSLPELINEQEVKKRMLATELSESANAQDEKRYTKAVEAWKDQGFTHEDLEDVSKTVVGARNMGIGATAEDNIINEKIGSYIKFPVWKQRKAVRDNYIIWQDAKAESEKVSKRLEKQHHPEAVDMLNKRADFFNGTLDTQGKIQEAKNEYEASARAYFISRGKDDQDTTFESYLQTVTDDYTREARKKVEEKIVTTKQKMETAFEKELAAQKEAKGDPEKELNWFQKLMKGFGGVAKLEARGEEMGELHGEEYKKAKKAFETLKSIEENISLVEEAERTGSDPDKSILKDIGEGLTSGLAKDFFTFGINEMNRELKTLNVANKLRDGKELTEEDELLLATYGMLQQAQQSNDPSRTFKIASGVKAMLPYMAQFAATGGIGTAVSSGTKVVIRKGLMKVVKKEIKDIAFKELRKQGTLAVLKEAGIRTTGYVVGAGAQTLLFPQQIAQEYAGRRIGDVSIKGELKKGTEEGKLEAGYKAAATMFSEVASERLGEAIFAPFFKRAKKVVGLGVKAKIAPKSRTLIKKVQEATAWDGLVNEYGEELVNSYSQALLTGDKKMSEVWDNEEQLVTLLTVASVSGSMYAANTGTKLIDKINKGTSLKDFTPEEIGAIDKIVEDFEGKTPIEIEDEIIEVIEEMPAEKGVDAITYVAKKLTRESSKVEQEEPIEDEVPETDTEKAKRLKEEGLNELDAILKKEDKPPKEPPVGGAGAMVEKKKPKPKPSLETGTTTTEKEIKVFSGRNGKKDIKGERKTSHPEVKDVTWATESETTAKEYGKETGVDKITIPPGTTIENIEVDSSLPLSEIIAAETDAINNSDAQVVRFVRKEGLGGDQVQYVIKDKSILKPEQDEQTKEAVPKDEVKATEQRKEPDLPGEVVEDDGKAEEEVKKGKVISTPETKQPVTDGKKVDVPQKGKQPWETTLKEALGEEMYNEVPILGQRTPEQLEEWKHLPIIESLLKHKAAIQKALKEGKEVPKEVLVDYPDLQKPTEVKKEAKPKSKKKPVSKEDKEIQQQNKRIKDHTLGILNKMIDVILTDEQKEILNKFPKKNKEYHDTFFKFVRARADEPSVREELANVSDIDIETGMVTIEYENEGKVRFKASDVYKKLTEVEKQYPPHREKSEHKPSPQVGRASIEEKEGTQYREKQKMLEEIDQRYKDMQSNIEMVKKGKGTKAQKKAAIATFEKERDMLKNLFNQVKNTDYELEQAKDDAMAYFAEKYPDYKTDEDGVVSSIEEYKLLKKYGFLSEKQKDLPKTLEVLFEYDKTRKAGITVKEAIAKNKQAIKDLQKKYDDALLRKDKKGHRKPKNKNEQRIEDRYKTGTYALNDEIKLLGNKQTIKKAQDHEKLGSIRSGQDAESKTSAIRSEAAHTSKAEDLEKIEEKIDKVVEGIDEAVKPAKDIDVPTKIQLKKEKAKKLASEGLSDIADILGTKKNITDERSPKLTDAIRKIASAIQLETEAKGLELIEAVKQFLKDHGYVVSDRNIEDILGEKVEPPKETIEEKGPKAKPKGDLIGITNAHNDAIMKSIDKDPIAKQARQENQVVWDKAIEDVRNGTVHTPSTVKELAASVDPPISLEMQAYILIDRIRISNERDTIVKMLAKALEKNNTGHIAQLMNREMELKIELQLNVLANQKMGTTWGRFGIFRQQLAAKDFSLQGLIDRATNENKGKEIKLKYEKALKIISEKYKALQGELEEIKKQQSEFAEQTEVDKQKLREDIEKGLIAEIKAKIAKTKKMGKKGNIKRKGKAIADKMRAAQLSNKGFTFSSVIPPSAIDAAIRVAAQTIETSADIAEGVRNGIVKGLEHIKKTDWWKSLGDSEQDDFKTKFTEYINGFLPKEDAPADLAQEFDGLVDKFIEESGGIWDETLVGLMNKITYNRVANGLETFDEVADSVYEALKDGFIELDKEQVRDLIANYGQLSKLNPAPINVRVRKLKRIGRLMVALRDVKERLRLPLRSGREREKPGQIERNLQTEIMQAIKEEGLKPILTDEDIENQWRSAEKAHHTRLENAIADVEKEIKTRKRKVRGKGRTFVDDRTKQLENILKTLREQRDALLGKPDKKLTDEQRIEMTIKALEKSIGSIQKGIQNISEGKTETGDIYPDKKQPREKLVDKRIEELRKLRDALKAERERLLPENIREGAAIEKYRKSRERRLKFLQAKIENKDFAPRVKTEPPPLTQREKKINAEIAKLEFEVEKIMEKIRLDNRGTTETIIDAFINLWSLPKGLKAGFDLSAPLRQGLLLIGEYKSFKNAFLEMHKMAFSEKVFDKWMEDIKESGEYLELSNYGLYISDTHASLAAKEEAFMSNFIKYFQMIPVVGRIHKGSERAYIGFLNKLRVDVFNNFKTALEDEGFSGKELTAELKSWAHYVNNATGRGKLKARFGDKKFNAEILAPALNATYFAPRLVISRFAVLNPLFYHNLSPKARKRALKNMVKFVGIMTSMVTMAAILLGDDWDTELNPLSSEWMKLRNKKTGITIDMFAGLIQVVRTAAQVIRGRKKNLRTGRIEKFSDEKGPYATSRWETAKRFLSYKMSPSTALVIGLTSGGEDVMGKEITIGGAAKGLMMPLYLDDMTEIMMEEGLGYGLGIGPLALYGMSVQHYDREPLTEKEKAELKKQDILEEIGIDMDEIKEFQKQLKEDME